MIEVSGKMDLEFRFMKSPYCLITPAYNESESIDRLVHSIAIQEEKPILWVIVNDGSNDDTGEKIDRYAAQLTFIKVVHLNRDNVASYYSRKIYAFNQGLKFLLDQDVDYRFIGNLDADISMPKNYYKNILSEFEKDKLLGIAGGQYIYPNKTQKPILYKTMVPGSILMFRRECFEEVGGYLPLKYGAEDSLACVMARHKGWKTYMFPVYVVIQHRIVGSAGGMSLIRSRFRQGLSEYDIGYHPLFSFIKLCKRSIMEKPLLLSGLYRYIGYLLGFFVIGRRSIPVEIVMFLRSEQNKRIFEIFGRKC